MLVKRVEQRTKDYALTLVSVGVAIRYAKKRTNM